MALVDLLIKDGWLKTERIINAFKEIKRSDFLPEEIKGLAETNEALPIGFGQTISQPLVVAFILELLQPEEGDKILDVGSGSGWTSALLAFIACPPKPEGQGMVRQKGKVISFEIIPELKEFGEKNVVKYDFIERGIVKFILGDASKGYSKEAPYDKILAGASGDRLPEEWKKQLKIGGRIVCPIGSSIWLFIKKSKNEFEEKEFQGFSFVPLISNSEK